MKIKKDPTKQKDNVKVPIPAKTNSLRPVDKSKKDRLSSAAVKTSSKRADAVKGLIPKSQSRTRTTGRPERRSSKILDTTKTGKMNISSQISTTSQFKDQKEKALETSIDKPIPPSETHKNGHVQIDPVVTSDPASSASPPSIIQVPL